MTQETQEILASETGRAEASAEPLPFPFNQRAFCHYEPIEKSIDEVRVLVVDDLLRDEDDLSDVAKNDWGLSIPMHLKRERQVAGMAIENIINNVHRLVKRPTTQVTHISNLPQAEAQFKPDAVVLSGTLRDFDYYNPKILEDFAESNARIGPSNTSIVLFVSLRRAIQSSEACVTRTPALGRITPGKRAFCASGRITGSSSIGFPTVSRYWQLHTSVAIK